MAESAAGAQSVKVEVFRWAGSWGPFKVKIPCGECTLTSDIIQDALDRELSSVPVAVETSDWLDVWWRPLRAGGWHAPIVMVEGRVVSQGHALNRGVFTEAVIGAHARRAPVEGNLVYGKETCPHCSRAKARLEDSGVEYEYRDVVRDPRSLYEMLARVKPIIGPKTPVTVPQIWLDGEYVGGADPLNEKLSAAGQAA